MVEKSEVQPQKEFHDDPNRYYQWSEEMQISAEKVLSQEPESSFQPMIQRRLEIDAQRNWDIFYRNNTTNFYKDRHYLTREFNELTEALQTASTPPVTLLDLGCGVGNAFWPMIEQFGAKIWIQCCDFSKRAVGFVRENSLFNPETMKAETCDLVNQDIPFETNTANFAQLIFVLSAISPEKHSLVAKKIYNQLADNAVLYFRDYGLYDLAQLRFAEKGTSKICKNFYVRADKTRAYYFTIEEV